MNIYPIYADLHTHTVSSGHGSRDTASDLARAAAASSLSLLGISDHGPATPGSARVSYFRGLALAPRKRLGVDMLYGVELNIRNVQGDVDLEEDVLSSLDYAFISMHPPTMDSMSRQENTAAYIAAMKHANVRFLGHIDDGRYPVDFEILLKAAKEHGVYPEINNTSLTPGAYRLDGPSNCLKILRICKDLELPVLLSSDSHGAKDVGHMGHALALLTECAFPASLVLNSRPAEVLEFITQKHQ